MPVWPLLELWGKIHLFIFFIMYPDNANTVPHVCQSTASTCTCMNYFIIVAIIIIYFNIDLKTSSC